MKKPVTFGRQTYSSLTELHRQCAHPTITFAAFYTRLRVGWPMKAALKTPRQHANKRRTFEVDGKVFKNLKALADAYGLTYRQVYQRMSRGWSKDEIAHGRKKTPKPKPKLRPKKAHGRARKITFRGVTYPSVTALCQAFGANRQRLYARRRGGHSVAQALGLEPFKDKRYERPANRLNRKAITYNGVKYPSIAELARAYGLKPNIMRLRLLNGWMLKHAVERQVVKRNRASFIIQGERFPSIKAASEHFNVHEMTIHYRLKRGYTPEQAVGLEPLFGKRTFDVQGQSFATLAAATRAYGMDYETVKARLRKGWSAEKAFDLVE